jgi:hypothetical protein
MEITTISVKTLDSVNHFLVVVLSHSADGSTIAMAEIVTCLKQWWVFEFLVHEGKKPTYVHEHLLTLYAEVTVDMNHVQWCVGH